MTPWKINRIALAMMVALLAWGGVARGDIPASLFRVGEDLRCGYLDAAGKVVLSGFAWTGDFAEGLAPVKMGGGFGFIDHTGKAVIPPRYRAVGHFADGLAAVEIGERCGYVDKTGALVIPPRYDAASAFHEGMAAVKVGDKYQEIDRTGAVVIPPNYQMMGELSEGLIAVCQDGKWGFIDKTGAVIITPQYEQAGPFANGLAPVKSAGKYGFLDKTGQWVVEAKYDDARSFSEGLAAVAITKRDVVRNAQGRVVSMKTVTRWGYLDPTGNVAIPIELWNVGQFSAGMAPVWKDGQLRYIDKTGATVVTPLFYSTSAGSYHDGLASVTIGQRYGYLNVDGVLVVPEQFSDASPFSDGLAAVQREPDGNWGYIDATGQMVIPPRFTSALPFHQGSARVLDINKWGLIDHAGTFTLAPQFDQIGWITDKVIAAKMNKLWGFFDLTGQVVQAPQFDAASFLGDAQAIVRKDHKYGVVDSDGKVVVAPQFDDCGWLYADGMLPVMEGGKVGLIDTAGARVITPQYAAAAGFTPERLCAVKVDGKWGFIDRDNKMVIPPRYDMTLGFSGGYAAVEIGGQWGFIDKTGITVAAQQFAAVGSFSDGLAPVKVNEQWGYLDTNGKLAIPAGFDVAGDFVNGLAKVKMGEQDGYINTTGRLLWTAQPDQMCRQFPEGLTQADSADTVATPADEQGVRVVTVQVAADQSFRQHPDWRALIEKRLAAVSDIYRKNFNIRFAITTIVPWDSPDFSENDAPEYYFTDLYDNLVKMFPLLDAEIVIGFTGQKRVGPEQGLAMTFARHALIDDDFNAKGDKEDFATLVTVHELCHLFGGFHVDNQHSFMYYSGSSELPCRLDEWSFDPFTTRQMRLMRDFNFRNGLDTLDDNHIKQSTATFLAGHAADPVTKNYLPTVAEGYLCRGQAFADKDQFSAAIRDYQKAIDLSQDMVYFANYGNIGLALLQQDRYSEGFAALRKCVELKPDSAFWHSALSRRLQWLQDLNTEFMECRQANAPENIGPRYLLTKVNPQEILEQSQLAVKCDPKVSLYHYRLGNVLLTDGQRQAALAEFQQAVDLASNNKGYTAKLEEVKAQQ